MPITAAELLTIGNERTGRSEATADIAKFIKACVHDLTIQGVRIEGAEDVTLSDDDPSYLESGFTNSYKRVIVITTIDSNSKESSPLDEISWQRYKERVSQGAGKGKPREYVRFNSTVYLWPPPNATDYPTMNISGLIYHADSTTISYNERLRECMTQYVIFKIFEKYGLAVKKGKAHFDLYGFEVEKILHDQAISRLSFTKYNDT